MSIYEALFGHNETWFDASVSLLFFLLIGRYLDHMMRERARGAILQLSRLMPSGATRLSEDGSLIYVPSSELVHRETGSWWPQATGCPWTAW
jgi:Cu2+-exporting ATPase